MIARAVLNFVFVLIMGGGLVPAFAQGSDQNALAPPPELPPPVVIAPELPKGAIELAPQARPSPPVVPSALLKSIAPPAAEAILPDRFTLDPRPALIAHGKGEWERAYDQIREAVTRVTRTAEASALHITGYPVAVFLETSDSGFTYDLMLPIEKAPSTPNAEWPADLRIGETPSGKAIRFVHLAAYDEIDGAYEQITAYLDAKDIVVKDAFIEEYITFGDKSNSPESTINIIVQPKK